MLEIWMWEGNSSLDCPHWALCIVLAFNVVCCMRDTPSWVGQLMQGALVGVGGLQRNWRMQKIQRGTDIAPSRMGVGWGRGPKTAPPCPPCQVLPLRGAVRSIPPPGKAEQPLIGSQMEQWRWINVNWIFLTLNKICIGMKLINRELSEGSLAHQCVRRQQYPSGRWWEEAAGKGIQLAASWN